MSGPGWLLRVLGGLPKPTKKPIPGDEPPRPLTRERIADYLVSRGLPVRRRRRRRPHRHLGREPVLVPAARRAAGDPAGPRALAPQPARSTSAAVVALAVNDWNRERIWPKAYLREEEGVLALYSEVSADFEPGVTDPQLAQLLACGLGTGVQMFSTLEALLPRDDVTPPDVPDN